MSVRAASPQSCRHPREPTAAMLDELIRSNAVDKRWAEELIAGAATLEDLERAAIGTADNRWRIPRFNGRACVDEVRHMARI